VLAALSDDPELRNYWLDARARQVETYVKNPRSRIQNDALEGMLLSTHCNRGRSSLYFAIGSAHFHPSKKLVDLS